MIVTEDWIYLFEFKVNRDDAMEQIKRMEYYKPYLHRRQRIMLIGVNFDSNKGNIRSWQDEELDRSKI